MSQGGQDDFVYDEVSGEWVSASEAAAAAASASQVEVRDSAGNVLKDGDSVTLIKDLKVKGKHPVRDADAQRPASGRN